MSKMGSHDPFGHLKHKLWSKEGRRPLKVGNRPNFFVCKWRVTYRWNAFDDGYNFASNLISIKALHTKLWTFKVARSLTMGIPGLPLGNAGTKWHLGGGPMAMHKVYYKGEGGGFPQSGLWWVLWVCVCPWLIHAPKVLHLCTNQLVVWFV
jgi:hypothetical protein